MLPNRFSEGKLKPVQSGDICSSLRFPPICRHAFAVWCRGCLVLLRGTCWSPPTPAFGCASPAEPGVFQLTLSRKFHESFNPFFFFCCDPPNGSRHTNPLSSSHPARGQHRAGDGVVAGGDRAVLAAELRGPSTATVEEAPAAQHAGAKPESCLQLGTISSSPEHQTNSSEWVIF